VPGRGPALTLVLLVLGALLAVCCCVDSADDAPTAGATAPSGAAVPAVRMAAAPATVEPADSCDPYTPAVGGAALYRNLPSGAGEEAMAVPVSSPLDAHPTAGAAAVPAPPPAPPPSPYQLCVMRT
jgi:hypothetical protein